MSQRERKLPAHVIYYSIALALHLEVSTREVQRCLRKGVCRLGEPGTIVDPAANRQAFSRPASACEANATGAFPQLRLIGLVETGTHVLCAAQVGAYATWEVRLTATVVPSRTPDICCRSKRATRMARIAARSGGTAMAGARTAR